MSHLRTLLPLLIVTFGLFGSASAAQGGWVTIKNETKQVIVIQETGGPANRPIRGKSVKLQPGETVREYHLLGGTKTVVIYDAAAPATPLVTDKLTWAKDDTSFAVKADGKKVTLAGGAVRADDKPATAKK